MTRSPRAAGTRPPLPAVRQVIGVAWCGGDPRVAVVAGGAPEPAARPGGAEGVIALLADRVLSEPDTVVGLDIPFSLPPAEMDALGLRSAGEVWRWAARRGSAAASPAGRDEAAVAGMPLLAAMCDLGVAVWPMDPPRLPLAVELAPGAGAEALALRLWRGAEALRALPVGDAAARRHGAVFPVAGSPA